MNICKKLIPYIALCLLGFLNTWLALGFLDNSTLISENAKHLHYVCAMFAKIQGGAPLSEILRTPTYPPAFYLNTALWFKCFGSQNEFAAILSITPFFLIAVCSIYALSKEYMSGRAAFGCALTLLSLLTTSLLLDGYFIDYSLTAWIALSFYLLTSKNKPPFAVRCFLIAFSLSLGLLCKWTFVSYVFAVFAALAVLKIIKNSVNRTWALPSAAQLKKALPALAAALLITLFFGWLLSLWYWPRSAEGGLSFLQSYYAVSRDQEIQTAVGHFKHTLPGLIQRAPSLCMWLYIVKSVLPLQLQALLIFGAIWLLCSLCSRKKTSGPRSFAGGAPAAALLTVLADTAVYSFYPTLQLFEPECTLRYIFPILPLLVFVCFAPLSRCPVKLQNGIGLVYTAIALSVLTSWALPKEHFLKKPMFFTPGFNTIYETYMTTVGSFQDPLGIITAPKSSRLEILGQKIAALSKAADANRFAAVCRLQNQEDFDPFLVILNRQIESGCIIDIGRPGPPRRYSIKDFRYDNSPLNGYPADSIYIERVSEFSASREDKYLNLTPRRETEERFGRSIASAEFFSLLRSDLRETYVIYTFKNCSSKGN